MRVKIRALLLGVIMRGALSISACFPTDYARRADFMRKCSRNDSTSSARNQRECFKARWDLKPDEYSDMKFTTRIKHHSLAKRRLIMRTNAQIAECFQIFVRLNCKENKPASAGLWKVNYERQLIYFGN